MTTPKRSARQKPAPPAGGPAASRPNMPDYGVPKTKTGLLPWSHVEARMAEATHYWISTVDSGRRPHATPVDGLWIEGRLYFGGAPQTRRNRNLAANPAVCVHLESGTDVVILHGEARALKAERTLAERLAEASRQKYGYGPGPDTYQAGGVYVFSPQLVFAWKNFPGDATRWKFLNSG
jgi:nitroimidazol reductase NimA-like FMN-containing flavoprotein (pyridoxamine 5'-phosphate oxidase superfamily)